MSIMTGLTWADGVNRPVGPAGAEGPARGRGQRLAAGDRADKHRASRWPAGYAGLAAGAPDGGRVVRRKAGLSRPL
jgi:hypothetical protein